MIVEAGKAYANRYGNVFYVHDVEWEYRFGKEAQLSRVTEFRFAVQQNVGEIGEKWEPIPYLVNGTKGQEVFPRWVDEDFVAEVPESLMDVLPIESVTN